MITRPLDLSSRLRPPPRGLDALFYVNVGALVVFFLLFGSRFVLSPGLAVDFRLPTAGAAARAHLESDVVITVPDSDVAIVDGAVLNFASLGAWLREKANEPGSRLLQPGQRLPENRRLLVHVSDRLPARDLARVYALAAEAGFAGVLLATTGQAVPSAP